MYIYIYEYIYNDPSQDDRRMGDRARPAGCRRFARDTFIVKTLIHKPQATASVNKSTLMQPIYIYIY